MADDINTPSDLDTAYEQAQSAPAIAQRPQVAQPVAQVSTPSPEDAVVNVINPEGTLVGLPASQLQEALNNGYSEATPDQVETYAKEQKYGTPGQMAITAAESLGKGLLGPISTGVERALGVSPEAMKGREEVNPFLSTTMEMAGFGVGALAGTAETRLLQEAAEASAAGDVTKAALLTQQAKNIGATKMFTQAGQLEKVGATAAELSGLQKGGFLAQAGADAIDGAVQMVLMQGGEELNNMFKNEPQKSASLVATDLGLAAIMGGVFGGAVGAGLRALKIKPSTIEEAMPKGPFISEMDKEALEAGDFKASVKHSGLPEKEQEGIFAELSKERKNADEIRKIGKDYNLPVMEGMVSDSKMVRKAEDSLIHGAPTYASINRSKLYTDGYNRAIAKVEETLGGSTHTKAELGTIIRDAFNNELTQNADVFEQLYGHLKQHYDVIPLSEKSAPSIARNIMDIKEVKISPSSPESKLAQRVAREINNLKTVDDVKIYRSALNRSVSPTASPGEKRMAAILSDKLKQLENSSIERFAEAQMKPVAAAPGIELEHYSSNPNLKEIDPKYFGTGVRGAEMARGPTVKRSYYYFANTTPEDLVAQGRTKYKVRLPESAKLYDLGKDPEQIVKDHILPSGAPEMDGVERAIKEKGYTGYYNSAHPSLPNAVAVFDKMPVAPKEARLGSHYLFSAENPVYPEANKLGLNTKETIDLLRSKGFDAIEVEGKYGAKEPSIMVKNITTPKQLSYLNNLAKDLGQEAGLFSTGTEHEMRFLNGQNAGKAFKGKGTAWHAAEPENNFTKLPTGEMFTHNLNFDKMAQGENLNKLIEKVPNRTGLNPDEIKGLLQNRKEVDAKYKEFITKFGRLTEQLGKGRIYGAQDAMNFINERLTPEEIVHKLFSKKDSEFLNFFKKEFPDQFEMLRQYQKSALREAASKTGEFSPKQFFKSVSVPAMEPEIQKAIFSPEELKKIKDMETYIRSFPENFNPSGTSHMSAWREFFHSPSGATIANIRDYGIEKFIKAVSASPEVSRAADLAKATLAGEKATTKAVKNVFTYGKEAGIAAAKMPRPKNVERLKKLVEDYNQDPSKMADINADVPVPAYSQQFAQITARAVQYLSTIRPKSQSMNPLDTNIKPSSMAEKEYERQLRIAQNPLTVLEHVKMGNITPNDIKTLTTIYPELHQHLSQKIMAQIVDVTNKGKTVPYQTRLNLSMFLGQALDSTMTQQGILAAQTTKGAASQGQQPQQMPPAKRSMSGISKMPTQFQTPGQAREAERSKGK